MLPGVPATPGSTWTLPTVLPEHCARSTARLGARPASSPRAPRAPACAGAAPSSARGRRMPAAPRRTAPRSRAGPAQLRALAPHPRPWRRLGPGTSRKRPRPLHAHAHAHVRTRTQPGLPFAAEPSESRETQRACAPGLGLAHARRHAHERQGGPREERFAHVLRGARMRTRGSGGGEFPGGRTVRRRSAHAS